MQNTGTEYVEKSVYIGVNLFIKSGEWDDEALQ
jgi:hypothetical protein